MATTTLYPVHPAAAVFPMMADAELDDLAKDIAARGLFDKIVLWRSGTEPDATVYLLDGRNRLAALERLGRAIEEHTIVLSTVDVPDPASYVISRNIKRRHLTKEQRAELIVKAIEVASTDSAKVARSVPRDEQGRVQGSTKDPVLTAAVEEGQKHGISKRTVQNARAKVKAETTPSSATTKAHERAVEGLSPDEQRRVKLIAATMAPRGKVKAEHLHRARACLAEPTTVSSLERLASSVDNTVYEEQGVTLVCGDARTLPALSAGGVIITDPPYNIGFDHDGEYDDNLAAEEYDELLRATVRPPCVVLHRPEGICRLSRLLGMDPNAVVAWVYDGIYARQWRAIAWFGIKPNLQGVGDWWNIQPLNGKRVEKTAHPCQIPQELVDRVVAVTPNLTFIVDPFAGSGTTLAVAKSRGLRALGIEQSRRFCEIAAQRLRDE